MRTVTKLLIVAAICTAFVISTEGQVPPNTKYDAEFAKKLGADEYGMKSYVLCILKTGPNDAKVTGKDRDAAFAGHMSNMGRLANEGKLTVAGPFMNNDLSFRGLFIFNVTSIEDAKKLVKTDPAVKAGIFIYDLLPWYGSAALTEVKGLHEKVQKTAF